MFSPEVKEQAMIACGRRCCLCHKFCGVKMECHHIVQEKDGGENTFENAIPLCFDHHAEVGHYSNEHPKGIKFRPEELRAHRDRWYAQVKQGTPEATPTEINKLDVELYIKILAFLGGSSRMTHFRDHDYSNSYDSRLDHDIDDVRYFFGLPDNHFFNGQVEAAFADFVSCISEYRAAMKDRVWHEPHHVANIPPEWLHEDANGKSQTERFFAAVEAMNPAATKVWEGYESLIKTARQQLMVNEPSRDELKKMRTELGKT